MTQADYLAFLARRNNPTGSTAASWEGDIPERLHESDLHDQILAECRRRGWLAIHSRMDKRTTNRVGTPDFIIAMNNGQTLFIEVKAKGKKLSTEQAATMAWLLKLGHSPKLVYSLNEFMALL